MLEQVPDQQAGAVSPPGVTAILAAGKVGSDGGQPLERLHPEAELIQIPDQLAPVLVLQQDLPAFTAPVFDLDIYNLPLAEIGPQLGQISRI